MVNACSRTTHAASARARALSPASGVPLEGSQSFAGPGEGPRGVWREANLAPRWPLLRAPPRVGVAAARSRCFVHLLRLRARGSGALLGPPALPWVTAEPLKIDGGPKHLRNSAHQPADCFGAVLHCLGSTLSEFQPWGGLCSTAGASSALKPTAQLSPRPLLPPAGGTGPPAPLCSAPRTQFDPPGEPWRCFLGEEGFALRTVRRRDQPATPLLLCECERLFYRLRRAHGPVMSCSAPPESEGRFALERS